MLINTALALALTVGAPAQDKVELTPVTKGMVQQLGGYMPMMVRLDQDKSVAKRLPKVEGQARLGRLSVGGKDYLVLLVEPENGPSRLYVDTNGNGDLTDDPATTWVGRPMESNGKTYTTMMGEFKVGHRLAGTSEPVTFGAYRFDPTDPGRAQLEDAILVYPDYGYKGEATIAGEKYPVMLADQGGTGYFTGPNAKGVALIIDRNRNGKIERRAEMFVVGKPFNIGGTTYEISGLPEAGGSFQLSKSSQTVAEIPLPPDFSIGKTVPPIAGKTLDGKQVTFPKSFPGKLVLLDVWATWCGPCIGEIPHMKKAYSKYRNQGLEILGVSIDDPEMETKVRDFVKERGIEWVQIYEGNGWQGKTVSDYGIEGIPFMLLVDGDTGQIVATEETLRGPQLGETVRKALAQKKAQ